MTRFATRWSTQLPADLLRRVRQLGPDRGRDPIVRDPLYPPVIPPPPDGTGLGRLTPEEVTALLKDRERRAAIRAGIEYPR